MKVMFSIMLFAILSACNKEPVKPTPPPTPTTSKLQILWKTPISPDTALYTSTAQALVDQGIVFSTNFYSPSAFVRVLNAQTGQLRWKFDNFIKPIDGFLTDMVLSVNNKVIINKWDRTYCVDAQNGSLDWSSDVSSIGNGAPLINTIENYVYKVHFTGQKPISASESMVRAHYLSEKWDTLLTINAADSFYLNIKPPTLWINPQGDSVLIIRENGLRDVHATSHEGRYNLANLYAWNIRTRQYEWQLKDFQDQQAFALAQPIVDGNRLYIHSHKVVFCINLLDGSLVWKKEFADGIYFGSLVQHNNLVMVHGSDHGLWALHKSDGREIWYNNTTIGTVNRLSYFDGVIYFTSSGSGLLYAIKAETGETIWAEFSANYSKRTPDVSFMFAEVIIDPVRRVLYTADGYYLMCIKLPE